jgi:oligopeptide/dipeptide ABC transporter ATP-binding protein
VFISHNLAVIRHLSSSVLVMYLGREMEQASREELFDRPLHPYTRALLASVPAADPSAARGVMPGLASGELPSPLDPPRGCVFETRCPFAEARCRQARPVVEDAGPGHRVACHRWREWKGAGVPSQA